ncbi:MAG: TRAP transporter small permease [Betaproteobacteria bacterium]
MHELLILALVVIALMVVTTVALRWVGPALRILELILLGGSVLVILLVALFVCAEVIMRYGFNSPIPGHLELSELLMPLIVFLALSYTQATRGHVGMDLVLENLPPRARLRATIGTLLISIFVCAVLAYFGYKNALQLIRYDDVTMSPPYYHTWPTAAAVAIGYAAISMRMFVQILHLYDPRRFPAYEPAGTGSDIDGAE